MALFLYGMSWRNRFRARSHGQMVNGKAVIGLVEPVKIIGQYRTVKIQALVDTGSTRTTVDMDIAAKAGLGPIVKAIKVKKSEGAYKQIKRIIVKGEIEIKGKRRHIEMTVSDRSKFQYPVLIGREILHHGFVIDLQKTHASHKLKDRKNN